MNNPFPMHYLLAGDDIARKEEKLIELKAGLLKPKDAQNFDYESLDGAKVDAGTLKKALMSLPVIAACRLVVIRNGHKLNTQNKNMIIDFVAYQQKHCTLILDSHEWTPSHALVKALKPKVRIFEFAGERKANVFDMTRAMTSRRQPEALKILERLLSEGNHPLQLMGGMIWSWGKMRGRVPQERFEQGLQYLQEADLNIKRSRLKPEFAVELAVVKLCELLG